MIALTTSGSLLALTTVAVVLLRRRPRHPVSVVLAVLTIGNVLLALGGRVPTGLAWPLAVLPLALLLVVFPDGPRGPLWRTAAGYLIAAVVAISLVGLAPSPHSPWLDVVAVGLALSVLAVGVVAFASLLELWRRSAGARRRRVGIVLAASAVLVMPYLLLPVYWLALRTLQVDARAVDAVVQALYTPAVFVVVPIAVGVSMLLEPVGQRAGTLDRLWPLMLGTGLCLLVAGTVTEVARAVGVPPGAPQAVAASAVCAAACAAGLTAFRGHGMAWQDEPGAAAARALRALAARLDQAPAPDEVPTLVTRTVATALDLRGAALDAVADGRDDRLAAWGDVEGDAATRDLFHGGERVGRLVLVPHTDGVPPDLAPLDVLAPSVAATVAAATMRSRLDRAHRRALAVREEERTRLRADLHDELSPSLAAVRLTLRSARRAAGCPDGQADDLLTRADAGLDAAGRVLRGILDDLRPDALADGGLLAAVRARAAEFHRTGALDVVVDVAARLPPLPPSTEVALLRVASEAMANAARHSAGSRCDVRLTPRGDGVLLTVADDGVGLGDADGPTQDGHRRELRAGSGLGPGLGLETMAARTAGVGGLCRTHSRPGGGFTVEAWFPGRLAEAPGFTTQEPAWR